MNNKALLSDYTQFHIRSLTAAVLINALLVLQVPKTVYKNMKCTERLDLIMHMTITFKHLRSIVEHNGIITTTSCLSLDQCSPLKANLCNHGILYCEFM